MGRGPLALPGSGLPTTSRTRSPGQRKVQCRRGCRITAERCLCAGPFLPTLKRHLVCSSQPPPGAGTGSPHCTEAPSHSGQQSRQQSRQGLPWSLLLAPHGSPTRTHTIPISQVRKLSPREPGTCPPSQGRQVACLLNSKPRAGNWCGPGPELQALRPRRGGDLVICSQEGEREEGLQSARPDPAGPPSGHSSFPTSLEGPLVTPLFGKVKSFPLALSNQWKSKAEAAFCF